MDISFVVKNAADYLSQSAFANTSLLRGKAQEYWRCLYLFHTIDILIV